MCFGKRHLFMKDDRVYLRHILDAIEKIEQYCMGIEPAEFIHDDMRVDAVVRELIIIGEATAHLSSGFQASHADIPYADIVGMRNRLIHEYFGVDVDAVFKTCEEDLPALRKIIENNLQQF